MDGDLNGRRGLRVTSWSRCNKFGVRFTGDGSLTRGVDAGKRPRQENGDVDNDGGAEVAWFVAVPRSDTLNVETPSSKDA